MSASPPTAKPPLIAGMPDEERVRLSRQWENYLSACELSGESPLLDATLLEVLSRVWTYSDFVAQACAAVPKLLHDLVNSGDLRRSYDGDDYRVQLEKFLLDAGDETQLMAALRGVRRREMVRIAWRDLSGWADLAETLRDLSSLAVTILNATLSRLESWQRAEFGAPLGQHSGLPLSLVVIGMGKLGAGELNFSSDIDLIFTYPEEGHTEGGRASLSNEEYFTRLGQRLIQVLDKRTEQGFVYRVDMRLRPFGDSGPLVMNFDAMEEYYQTHGREWERYAWIKAAVVAGDQPAGDRLLTRLRPFVYRRYLDFGAFEALRDMKAQIAQQVRRKGMEHNIKLGAGGIREVEFMGQAFQLIRGGREPQLQERAILSVLRYLSEADYLPDYVTQELADAYIFLRHTENRLQEYTDQQTHELPADAAGRWRLAAAMGYSERNEFERRLQQHRQRVHEYFEQISAAPQTAADAAANTELAGVWQGTLDESQAMAVLSAAGFDDAAEALRLIAGLRESASCRSLTAHGRGRLDALMNLLLGALAGAAAPVVTLKRVSALIEKIAGRTTYLALLAEHPLALSQLIRLCAASSWLAGLLTRHPLLLDELLDPRSLYAPPDRASLQGDLHQLLARIPAEDLEQQMELLRQFKDANVLRVAAADLAKIYPLMVVSDHLTEIAEVVLAEVLVLARSQLEVKHGAPCYREHDASCKAEFVIVGYGKLGGIELGYGSDLDLVFLHDSHGEQQLTCGPKAVDNAVFFARLGQRIIHLIQTRTPAGILYEVDMRLRPSGSAGLLVSSLEAYADYQRREAWVWEHQALVRARVVAGDPGLAGRFQALRQEILTQPRDRAVLRLEVRNMRERMRAELGQQDRARFDIKQDKGGIADIEFMVQYCVLAWAHDYPDLVYYTDNIRMLEGMARAGLMVTQDLALLSDAYRAYRARVHQLTLQEEPAIVAASEFEYYRAGVMRIWHELME